MTSLVAVEAREPGRPRFVVTVGTDHHPFDRLIGWTNDWLSRHPEQIADFFMQVGPASVKAACHSSQFIEVSQLDALLDSADVIICHGGPGCIADAWTRGRVPIVVPRIPRLGEIVDKHQVDFCHKLADVGRIRLAQTAAEFASLLDEATRDQSRFGSGAPTGDVTAAVARFGELVEELVSQPRHRLPLIQRGRQIRRRAEMRTGTTHGPRDSVAWNTPGGQYDVSRTRRDSALQLRWEGG